jgi:hypothetical protein
MLSETDEAKSLAKNVKNVSLKVAYIQYLPAPFFHEHLFNSFQQFRNKPKLFKFFYFDF